MLSLRYAGVACFCLTMCDDMTPIFRHAVSWQNDNALSVQTCVLNLSCMLLLQCRGSIALLLSVQPCVVTGHPLSCMWSLQCHGSVATPLPTLCLIIFVDGLQQLDTVR